MHKLCLRIETVLLLWLCFLCGKLVQQRGSPLEDASLLLKADLVRDDEVAIDCVKLGAYGGDGFC